MIREVTTNPSEVASALNRLEGYPRDPSHRGSRCPPAPFGRTVGHQVYTDGETEQESTFAEQDVLDAHAGQAVGVGDVVVTIAEDGGEVHDAANVAAVAEARSSVSVTMDNANASTSEDMTADVVAESSVAVDMEAYGEVAAVAEGESSMTVDMQAYGEVATVAAGESSVSATMDDANATTMPTPTMELDFEGPNPFSDKSGNGNHPTNNGVTAETNAAVTGQVGRFVASESRSLSTPVALGGSYTSFAVIVMRIEWSSSTQGIYAAPDANPLLMRHFGGIKAYNDHYNNRVESTTNPSDWSAGEVHTVAVRYDADAEALRVYIDGVFEAEGIERAAPSGVSGVEIGELDGADYLDQDMSYIALWDGDVLSDAEIAQLHSDHIGGE